MSAKVQVFGQPVPDLPVADVPRAQQYYKDSLGFEIGWLAADHDIGAVSRDKTVLFLGRRTASFEPVVLWPFTDNLDALHLELQQLGALIPAVPNADHGAAPVHPVRC